LPSIDWNKKVTLIDFQKAESQEPVRDYEFKNRLLQAIGVSDNDWELEWSYLKSYLNKKQITIIELTFKGYTLKQISILLKKTISQSQVSRERKKALIKIRNLY
tara:strand:+ start:5622 stop:5933 length:312 start_codon:yes stop_codon:yes gene_type:complete